MDNRTKLCVDAYLERNKGVILEDLKSLIRIKSVSDGSSEVKPFGEGCRRALDKALELAGSKGFKTLNSDYWYGLASFGSGEKTLGIFSHIDVVPEGRGWIYSPYEPVVKDGMLIGRGAADDKCGAVIGLHAMNCLKEMGWPLKSSVCLYLGCSEETGMGDIERYVKERKQPDFSLVPDSSFPVCHGEKGIMNLTVTAPAVFEQISGFSAGTVSNMVAGDAEARLPASDMLRRELQVLLKDNKHISFSEKDGVITVSAKGRASHASAPEGSLNAVWLLAGLFSGLRSLSPSDASLMASVAAMLSDSYGMALGIAFEDEPSGRLTCVNGIAGMTDDKKLRLSLDIRYPVTDKGERPAAELKEYFGGRGWEINRLTDSPPMYIPADDPKIAALSEIYTRITGEDGSPYVMGGGTYARSLEAAVSFGPNGDEEHPQLPESLGLPEGHGGIHQPDETMPLETLYNAIRIYALSLIELDEIINR